MAQFLVLAYDATDAEAPARRKAARPAHFEGIKPMVAKGEIVVGAALLNDQGGMVGSVVVTEFPSRAELDAWLTREPYVKERVWTKIEVRPVRIAVREGKINP
ncbi:MAG TPA: YciI family protein [Stellaceae bacterium]|nr:YciI family protein [Stellaceae bacterium]HYC15034.1 YciI family protein [Stellaceae bacterium]